MPLYIDFHAKMPQLPPDAIEKMKATIGKPDALGVKNINAYLTRDGQGYCITEGPNVDAVCKHHEAAGITLGKGDVHEVATTFVK